MLTVLVPLWTMDPRLCDLNFSVVLQNEMGETQPNVLVTKTMMEMSIS